MITVTLFPTAQYGGDYLVSVQFASDDFRADHEAAVVFAARFTRARKVGVSSCSTYANGRDYSDGSVTYPVPMVSSFCFVSTGTTGVKNEAAAKRLRAFLADLEKMDDVTVIESHSYGNSCSLGAVLEAN